MAKMMIDDVVIAEMNEFEADQIKRLADRGPGYVVGPTHITLGLSTSLNVTEHELALAVRFEHMGPP